MDLLDFLTQKEKIDIKTSIETQMLDLKEHLNDKNNFKKKEDWRNMSFVKEESNE